MHYLRPLLLSLLFLFIACENKTEQINLLSEDYQSIDTDRLTAEEANLERESLRQSMSLNTLQSKAKQQHIYLSRHAEKQSDITDPGLTEKGKQRALWIAQFLLDKSIDVIYSTDYRRTKETVAPFAELTDKIIAIYDPRKLHVFAQKIIVDGRNSYISGHSNTTPELIKLLGSESTISITENDYDQLFHLRIDEEGLVKTEIIKSLASDN